MDLWQKARTFAEEAARRSQELTKEAAKRSSELTAGSSRLSDIVLEASKRSKEIAAEASKRSKEIAAEASKRADQIRVEAAKRADQIKSLAENIALAETTAGQQLQEENPERFGVTEELREFVKEITMSTFRDFPLQDDSEMSDIPTESNVRQDLNEWQVKHASLVLSKVKEISKLRYELCPRIMKERKFWRIYFILVNSHIEPYEKCYMEDVKLKASEQVKDDGVKEPSKDEIIPKPEAKELNQYSKTSTSYTAEQDLDVFLLGGDSDEDPGLSDGADGEFNDDLDDMVGISDDEKEKL
ncbi:BSD domain containing protein [Melia azedarach]|uniref:BSD domain containing protein n=1 Tax=Melia azedarach TaxID=155640 RepID=A0ACC1XQS1_MELAZ|nr:BSD domain containing protein [Melia azedarach]